MTNLSIEHLLKKYQISMGHGNPYRLCKIRDYDQNLEKVWHVEYYIYDETAKETVRRRVTLSHKTKKARYDFAKQVINDIDPLLIAGAVINKIEKQKSAVEAVVASTRLIDACEYFIKFNETILKKRSHDTYKVCIKRFASFLKKENIERLAISKFTEIQARQFLDELVMKDKMANRSRNNVKGTITTFFNFFKKRKIITANPFLDIEKLPHSSVKHTAFSKIQAENFKNECIAQNEQQLLLFITFIYYSFLRPIYELRLLKVGEIKAKTILVPADRAKDSETEHVMIPKGLQKVIENAKLREYPEDFYVFGKNNEPSPEPVYRDYFYQKHVKILERLKLTKQNLDTYSWKHTGAIALFQATQNIELVRQQCRHSDIATTQKYLRDLGQFIDYTQIDKFPEF